MIKPVVKQTEQEKVKTWISRFIKFNLIGFFGLLIGTTVFTLVFPYYGAWTWLIANGAGAIPQFALITYFNRKKRGLMFEQCLTVKD